MSHEKNRMIDAGNGTRKKEMKVLFMGLGRTGTTALADGLKQLGFTPYDYIDRFSKGHFEHWNNAMISKFEGVGKPFGRREFDELTGDFDCILDVPCCFFAVDLCKAYPSAKVVLNTRDADDWLRSMNQTLFTVFRWQSWKLLRFTNPGRCGIWCQHNDLIWKHFCDQDFDNEDKCKQRFREHNEYVRRSVPSERLLEYDIKQGWKPITRFLGLPDFAGTVNRYSSKEFLVTHEKIWKRVLWNSAKNLGIVTIVLCSAMITLKVTRAQLIRHWLK